MPTESLTHNFTISDPDIVNRFVQALDETEPFSTPIENSIPNKETSPAALSRITAKLLNKV